MPAAREQPITQIGMDAVSPNLPGLPVLTAETIPERVVVLVAEDENVARMAVVDMLQEAGFETVEASSGQEAMLALEERPGIRLLVTDIDMPLGIDGITLAACVHRR